MGRAIMVEQVIALCYNDNWSFPFRSMSEIVLTVILEWHVEPLISSPSSVSRFLPATIL